MESWDDVYLWLPSGMYWPDLQSKPGIITLPGNTPIGTSLILAALVLLLRTAFHTVIALPLANLLGVNKSKSGYLANYVVGKTHNSVKI